MNRENPICYMHDCLFFKGDGVPTLKGAWELRNRQQ
jgi:hypothetical protein